MTKADIFNLSLGLLLLERRVTNADTDTSNEAKVLRTFWDTAFNAALESMNLDSTSTEAALELVETDPTDQWGFSYKYPTACAFFRRVQSCQVVDQKDSHIPKLIKIRGGQKVILTNQSDAIGEFITNLVPLSSLSASACLTIAYRLADMAAPLIVGKGASQLRKELSEKYVSIKAEAQEQDRLENFNFESEETMSEFVRDRMS